MHNTSPTSEERVLAALAHAGIIVNAFNLLGIVSAAIIWLAQRKQSPYVANHALHALVYQSIVALLTPLLLSLWGGCILVSLLPALIEPALYQADFPPTFWLAILLGLFVGGFLLGVVGQGLIGAIAAWRGASFDYPVVSYIVRLYTTAPPPAHRWHDEEAETLE